MQKLGLNPWITIWTNPKRTIHAVAESNPKTAFFYLAAISFLDSFFYFNSFYFLNLSYRLAITLVTVIVLSPVIGAIWFYLFGWILWVVGKFLNGKASNAYIRCAFAWTRVPLILNLLMWFGFLLFSPSQIFIFKASGFSYIFMNLIVVISNIWALIIFVQAISEIEHFSYLRSLVMITFSYLIFFAFVGIVCLLFYLFCPMF